MTDARLNLFDFIPAGEHAAIQARTSGFDCAASFAAAQAALPAAGGSIFVGPGKFEFGSTVSISRPLVLEGCSSGQGNATAATELKFPADTTGIQVEVAAQGSMVRGLALVSSGGTLGHGINLKQHSKVEDCRIVGFAQNGINCDSTVASVNVNGVTLLSNRISGCYHGIFFDGGDSNAAVTMGNDIASCSGWGIFDSGFLGNTHIGNRTAFCALGAYKTDNLNARHVFLGCYSESGQPPSSILKPAIVVGGIHAAGFDAATNCIRILDTTVTLPGALIGQTTALTAGATGVGEFQSIHNNGSYNNARGGRIGFYAGYKADGVTKRPVAAFGGHGLLATVETYDAVIDAWKLAAEFGTDGIHLFPAAASTPTVNGEMRFELVSNTSLKVKVKGSDGVVRSATLTLT